MKQPIELYWNSLPSSPNDALTYDDLTALWMENKRAVRAILHELSVWDDGTDEILIRSTRGGFYKTANPALIAEYRKEVYNRGRRTFACLKKIDRVLRYNSLQFTMQNNLGYLRAENKMTQRDLCDRVKGFGVQITPSIVSQIEDGLIHPSALLTSIFAIIFDVSPAEVAGCDL